jgi:glycosyltransferase involved in cell wall biosynthesis
MTGILFEGFNLSLSHWTGIATYASNLNEAARGCGYTTSVLLNFRTPLSKRDTVLNEINFFDATLTSEPTIGERVRAIKYQAFGSPLGIKAVELHRTGAVIDSAPATVAGFDRMFGATAFNEAAKGHFMRYGKRAKLNVDGKFSIFHATHPIPLRVAGCPNIYTVHDIIPLRLPFATLDNKRYFLRMMRYLCRKADHIITVSEHTRKDVMELFGVNEDRITNTYQSVHIPKTLIDTNINGAADSIANAFKLDFEDYFLFVGAIEPKKNLSRLIDAYAASGTKRPLIIVGALGWQYKSELEKIKAERFLRYEVAQDLVTPRRQVRHLSQVPFEQLVALIRGARAVLFPSLYEGFGLPVLEAMLLGAPVMTSKVASLPEVAGDAALFVDPLNIGDMARAIRMLDSDDDLRQELRRRGPIRAELFSPVQYRERLNDLYRRLMN